LAEPPNSAEHSRVKQGHGDQVSLKKGLLAHHKKRDRATGFIAMTGSAAAIGRATVPLLFSPVPPW
jgi:hypothetical protein